MEYKQTTISFDQPEVTFVPEKEVSFTPEHNRGFENNESLAENRLHFSNQAKMVLTELLKGQPVSSLKMMQPPWNILDVRARIFAIERILKITIPETKIPGAHGAKEWKLTKELIEEVNMKMNC